MPFIALPAVVVVICLAFLMLLPVLMFALMFQRIFNRNHEQPNEVPRGDDYQGGNSGAAQPGSLVVEGMNHGDLANLTRGNPPPLHFMGKSARRKAIKKRRKS